MELTELLLKDKGILDVEIDIARPGESIRIIPVKDVIEPRAKLDEDKSKVRIFAELLYSEKLIEDKSDKAKDDFYTNLVLNNALGSVDKLSKETEEVRTKLIDDSHYFECSISQDDLIAEDVKVIEIDSTIKLIYCNEDYSQDLDPSVMDLISRKMCKFSEQISDLLKSLKIKFRIKQVENYITKAKKSINKALGELVIWLKKYKKIVMFSGGKDSTAMLIKMIEEGQKIDKIVFADTMLEFPEMSNI